MGTVSTIRRAPAGAPPPLSDTRQRLADAIAAERGATERLAILDRAHARAGEEMQAAETELAAARTSAEEADRRASEHAVARLTGAPVPDVPSRAEATRRLQAAMDAEQDAAAARRTIGNEVDALNVGARDRADRIRSAAERVLAEEMADAAAGLVAEINRLHAELTDRGKALHWLSSHAGVNMFNSPIPGMGEARQALTLPCDMRPFWHQRGSSPTADRYEAALEALKRDPAAEVPR